MFEITVIGGTARGSENLCHTCKNALVREDNFNRQSVKCSAGAGWVKTKTVRCSDYIHRNLTEKWDLEKIAWTITADPKGKVGFTPPKKEQF